MIYKLRNRLLIAAAGAGSLFFLWFSCAPVTGSILETETTVSLQFQKRMQDAIDKIFGKDKASILVNVKLGLTKEVKDNIKKSLEIPKTVAAAIPDNNGKSSRLLWWDQNFDAGIYILPGFLADNKEKNISDLPKAMVVEQKHFQPDSRMILYAGVEIERIIIEVILDKALPNDAEKIISSVISNFIQTDTARGDSLTFTRLTRPSPWTEMIKDSGTLYDAMQKTVLLAGIIVVASLITWPWFNLAHTLRRFTENVVRNMPFLIQERNKSVGPSEGTDNPALIPPKEETLPQPTSYADETALMFNVKPEQVGHLYHLLNHENPDNIALVLPHLEPEVRKAFMALLPEDLAMEVTSSLVKVRYVDPDVILRLKQELEHHLHGVVGGVEQAVELLRTMDPPAKKRFLINLNIKEPDMAKAVRRKILFFKDLLILSASDLKLLLGNVKLEELAIALTDIDAGTAQKIIASLPQKSQTVLQQMMVFQTKPSKKDITDVQERILAELMKLAEENKIGNNFLNEIEKNLW